MIIYDYVMGESVEELFVEGIVCLGEMHCRQKHDLTLQAIMSLVMCGPNNHLSSGLYHEILTRGNSC